MAYQRCNLSLDSLLSTCLPQLPDPRSIMPTGQIPHFLALSSRLTGLPRWLTDKESSCQCRRHEKHRFYPWVAKIPWKRNANPLQNSCLRNPTDREAGWDIVCGAAKSWTQLSTSTSGHSSLFLNLFLPSFIYSLIHMSVFYIFPLLAFSTYVLCFSGFSRILFCLLEYLGLHLCVSKPYQSFKTLISCCLQKPHVIL